MAAVTTVILTAGIIAILFGGKKKKDTCTKARDRLKQLATAEGKSFSKEQYAAMVAVCRTGTPQQQAQFLACVMAAKTFTEALTLCGTTPIDPEKPSDLDPFIVLPDESIHALVCPYWLIYGATETLSQIAARMLADRYKLHTWPPGSGATAIENAAWSRVLLVLAAIADGSTPCVNPDVDPAFVASIKRCAGVAYNAALWPDPVSVIMELRRLGLGKAVPESNVDIQSWEWVQELKRFQTTARSMGLTGYANKPASYIDGICGACTLLALTDARARRKAGTWTVVFQTSPLLTYGPPPAGPGDGGSVF
jgi:hypothetical protein